MARPLSSTAVIVTPAIMPSSYSVTVLPVSPAPASPDCKAWEDASLASSSQQTASPQSPSCWVSNPVMQAGLRNPELPVHEPNAKEEAARLPSPGAFHASWSDSALSSHTVEADHPFHMSDLAEAALADLDGFIEEGEEGEEGEL